MQRRLDIVLSSDIAAYNPVNRALTAGRTALAALTVGISLKCFRSCQKSV
ncbi:hypothetical protein ACFYXF_00830 [Streptomyces sp. NPDC002680]